MPLFLNGNAKSLIASGYQRDSKKVLASSIVERKNILEPIGGLGQRTPLTGLNIMSEHQIETAFLRSLILYADSDESLKLKDGIAQVQHDEHCVRRWAWAMTLLLTLGLVGVGYRALLQEHFSYHLPHHLINGLCALVLASVVCLMAFAVLLTVYRRRLNRLRKECRRLVTNLLELHLGKPRISTLARSRREPDNREAVQDAVEISSDPGSLGSPSWLSNRLCG